MISLLSVLIATILIGAVLVFVFIRYRRKRGDKMSAARMAAIGMTTYAAPVSPPPVHRHANGNAGAAVFTECKSTKEGVYNDGYEAAERYDIDNIDSKTNAAPYREKVFNYIICSD